MSEEVEGSIDWVEEMAKNMQRKTVVLIEDAILLELL